MSSPPPLNSRARALAWVTSAAGLVLLAHAIATVLARPVDLTWVVLTLLAALSGLALLGSRGLPANVSIGDSFSLASLFTFGPAAGALTSAVDSLCCDVRLKGAEPAQLAFNVAAPMLAMWLAGVVVFDGLGFPLPSARPPVATAAVAAALAAAVFFLAETALVAGAVSLQRRMAPAVVWRGLAGLWPGPAVGAYLGCLIAYSSGVLGAPFALWLLPIPVLLYVGFRTWFGRIDDRLHHLEDRTRAYRAMVECLATAVDAKDEVTHGHVLRVQEYGRALARATGIDDPGDLEALDSACVLHDIGKLGIPERILNKPGRLTAAEFEVMKQHVDIGTKILSRSEALQAVLPIVRHHHENWDGSGYPDGVRGRNIPVGARILMIVDCFDALTSDRPYRKRLTPAAALDVLRSRRGVMYDPDLVDAFIAMQPRLAHLLPEIAAAPDAPPARSASDAPREVALLLDLLAARARGWVASWWELTPDGARAVLQAARGSGAEGLAGLATVADAGVSGWVLVHHQEMPGSDGRLDVGDALGGDGPLRCLSRPARLGGRSGALTLYEVVPGGMSLADLEPLIDALLAAPAAVEPPS
jgi:putative nucleotidyltransferase with HDIG domain